MLENNSSLQSYVNTFKKLYIKSELETEKGKGLLQQKAKVFSLDATKIQEVQDGLLNDFQNVEKFIRNSIVHNAKGEVSSFLEQEYKEIYSVCRLLTLSKEEVDIIAKKISSDKSVGYTQLEELIRFLITQNEENGEDGLSADDYEEIYETAATMHINDDKVDELIEKSLAEMDSEDDDDDDDDDDGDDDDDDDDDDEGDEVETTETETSRLLALINDVDSLPDLKKTKLETINLDENLFVQFLALMGASPVQAVQNAYSSIGNADLKRRVFLYNEDDKANKKFGTAFSTFAFTEKGEIPIFLYDDSTFVSGKSGVLVTNRRIFVSNFMEGKVVLDVDCVKMIYFRRDKLFVDYQELKLLMLNKLKEKQELCDFLNFLIYIIQANNGNLTGEENQKDHYDIGLEKYLYLCNKISDMLLISSMRRRVFIFDKSDIAVKTKFSNALDTYAKIAQDEYPLVLFDNSIAGNGKSGILITNRFFYASVIMSKPVKLYIPSIKDIRISLGELLVEPCTEKLPINYIDSSDRTEFTIFLEALTSMLNIASIKEFQEDTYNLSIDEFDAYIKHIMDKLGNGDEA